MTDVEIPNVTFDSVADAVYVYVNNTQEQVHYSQVMGNGVTIDFNADGTIYGIEILNASKCNPAKADIFVE